MKQLVNGAGYEGVMVVTSTNYKFILIHDDQ